MNTTQVSINTEAKEWLASKDAERAVLVNQINNLINAFENAHCNEDLGITLVPRFDKGQFKAGFSIDLNKFKSHV